MAKVITKVVLSMATGDVLEEESFEYGGEWALLDGGGGGPLGAGIGTLMAGPIGGAAGYYGANNMSGAIGAADEAGIPLDQIFWPFGGQGMPGLDVPQLPKGRLGVKGLKALQKYQLALQGVRMKKKKGGGFKVVPLTEEQMTNILGEDVAQQVLNNQAIQTAMQERTQAALAGDLPVSPALEESLREQQQATALGVARGSGAQSTPGIQLLAEQQTGANIAREAARQGQLTTGLGQNMLMQQQTAGMRAAPLQTVQQYLGSIGVGQQQLATQLQLANIMGQYGQQAAHTQGIYGLGGTILGGIFG
jgi:hypothetical protein